MTRFPSFATYCKSGSVFCQIFYTAFPFRATYIIISHTALKMPVGNGTGWGVEEQKEQDAISDLSVNPVFLARAKAAYGAIERADGPSARWIYQSWALLDRAEFNPTSLGPAEALSRLHGFSSAVPEGNFILLDMSHNAGSTARIQRSHPDDGRDGGGMWRDPWNGSWGLPFIWTALPVSLLRCVRN